MDSESIDYGHNNYRSVDGDLRDPDILSDLDEVSAQGGSSAGGSDLSQAVVWW